MLRTREPFFDGLCRLNCVWARVELRASEGWATLEWDQAISSASLLRLSERCHRQWRNLKALDRVIFGVSKSVLCRVECKECAMALRF